MKTPILILHGWSKNLTGKSYSELQKILEQHGFQVFAPDLPGFGSEPLRQQRRDRLLDRRGNGSFEQISLTLDDYVDFVKDYIGKKNLKKVIIIGHSFGGRIAAKLAVRHPELIEKLIISGSPLIKQPLSFKKKGLQYLARFGKQTLAVFPQKIQDALKKVLYHAIGEWDYYKAGELKETLKNIIAEDTASLLPRISVPTLVIWGEDDTFVSVEVAKEIVKKIPRAQLKILPQAGHRIPYENPKVFADSLMPFLT